MPVYHSHLSSYQNLNLGRRIRDERQQQGITLQELARRTKLSTACLSQIENEQRILDVCQAVAIAEALGTPLQSLLPSDSPVPYQITRDDDIRSHPPREATIVSLPTGKRELHPNAFWPLADLFVGRQIEPMLVRVNATPDHALRFNHHHEHEFAFVLRGTIEFLIRTPKGLQKEELAQGDCIYFMSSFPHSLRSATAAPAETIQVSSSSSPLMYGFDWSSPLGMGLLEDDDDGDLAIVLGKAIGFHRAAHGWTLEETARLLGLKKWQLKQIEWGERPASLETVMKCARAFGKPLSELIRDPHAAGPYYFVHRSSDIGRLHPRKRRVPIERPNTQFLSLASGFPTRQMYPYFVRIPNVESDVLSPYGHHGQEFFYVLEGRVDMIIRKDQQEITETLKAGDCGYLDTAFPHVLYGQALNPYSETSAEVLVVFWSQLGESYLFDD